MAISKTPRLGLTRWTADTDLWDREDFDGDNERLEQQVAIDSGDGLLSNRPAPGIKGRYYFASDVDYLYRDNGTAWVPIGLTPIGAGLLWFMPGNLPLNYAEPLGQAISRADHAALFALWGTFHGPGDGSTTFNLPNATGRSIVGLDDAQAEFNPVGKRGGAKTHTLTVPELPAHDHEYRRGQLETVSVGQPPSPSVDSGDGVRIERTSTTGGGLAHNNLSPYFVGRYIIRIR